MYDTPHSLDAVNIHAALTPSERAPDDSFAHASLQVDLAAIQSPGELLPTDEDLAYAGALAVRPTADVVLQDSELPSPHDTPDVADTNRPESDSEPQTAHGLDLPPPIKPPGDSPKAAGDFPERPRATPTLEPGQVQTLQYEGLDPYPPVHLQEGAIVRPREELEDHDPTAPEVYADEQDPSLHVPTDTALVARSEPGEDLILHTRSHGGEVATLYNPETNEGAIVRTDPSHEGATLENFVERVADAVSALGVPGATVAIVGNLEPRVTAEGGSSSPGTGLAEYLRVFRGVEQINLVHDPHGDATVTLDVNTGIATVTVGEETHRFEPAVPQEQIVTSEVAAETTTISSPELSEPTSAADILQQNEFPSIVAENVIEEAMEEIAPLLDDLTTSDASAEAKADALDQIIPAGGQGLEILNRLITNQHPILEQLTLEQEGDMHIADLVADRVLQVYEALEERLRSLDPAASGSPAQQSALTQRLETLDIIISQLTQLQTTREGRRRARDIDRD